jgi:Flp pilus assembly protein TadB
VHRQLLLQLQHLELQLLRLVDVCCQRAQACRGWRSCRRACAWRGSKGRALLLLLLLLLLLVVVSLLLQGLLYWQGVHLLLLCWYLQRLSRLLWCLLRW